MAEFLKAKPYDGQPVLWAHHKLDGHRLKVYRESSREVRCITTTGEDLYPRLREFFWAQSFRRLDEDCVLDGELIVPNQKASYVKTAIKEQDPQLVFIPFAVPTWQGQEIHGASLHPVADICLNLGLSFSPYKQLQPGWKVSELLQECKDQQLEGLVLKVANYQGWWKIKVTHTIDLIVTSVIPGKGKYYGQVGALVCSTAEGYEVANVSGMTEPERVSMSPADIGRVVEVEYQSVLSRGRLQHPRFLRWRDDKYACDCTTLQDKHLWLHWNPEAGS